MMFARTGSGHRRVRRDCLFRSLLFPVLPADSLFSSPVILGRFLGFLALFQRLASFARAISLLLQVSAGITAWSAPLRRETERGTG
jgi:hypothetical protein